MSQRADATGERWLTAEEAARHLGFRSVGTLYNKMGTDDAPPHRKLGRSLRFRVSELDAWVESQSAEATESDNDTAKQRGTA